MPYIVRDNTVYKKTDGQKKVGSSRNVKKYVKTLRAIEKGWKPTGRK
jgi:hypothetical protein